MNNFNWNLNLENCGVFENSMCDRSHAFPKAAVCTTTSNCSNFNRSAVFSSNTHHPALNCYCIGSFDCTSHSKGFHEVQRILFHINLCKLAQKFQHFSSCMWHFEQNLSPSLSSFYYSFFFNVYVTFLCSHSTGRLYMSTPSHTNSNIYNLQCTYSTLWNRCLVRIVVELSSIHIN